MSLSYSEIKEIVFNFTESKEDGSFLLTNLIIDKTTGQNKW
jgi:hypothetical protein